MARREDIDNAIWGDPTFERLSADAKLLYLWSFTNPYCNMAGLYKASPARMVRETGLPPQRKARASNELAVAGLLVRHDEWIWVRSRVKYLRTKSPAMAASIIADVSQLAPDHPLRALFVAEYGTFPWLVSKGGEAWGALCSVTSGVTSDLAVESQNKGGSIEGLGTLKGNGNGSLSSTDTTTENDELDAPERIFEHWQKILAPNARFTPGRREKVKARLKAYPAERILRAIDGCAASEFHVQNGHVDLTLICRSDEKLEQFEALPLRVEGVKGRDGTQVKGPGLLSSRRACRKCAQGISNEQANNQSGMCDGCYEAFEASALGAA